MTQRSATHRRAAHREPQGVRQKKALEGALALVLVVFVGLLALAGILAIVLAIRA